MSAAVASRTGAGPGTILACGALALASVPAAIALGETRLPFLLGGAAGLAVLASILVSGWLRPFLLSLTVFAITYNRQYYWFEWLHGPLGERGLYWGPGDLCLAALLLLWPIERALRIRPGPGRVSGASGAAWLLPLLLVGALSAASGPEPWGSLFELFRYAKLAILLLYLRDNLDDRGRVVIMASLAGVVLLQAPIAALQVAFASGQNGLSQIFQSSEPGELARRAAGTLGHPNYLAPYLLLITPPFVALALGRAGTQLGHAAAFVAACGTVSVVLTQSRGPITLLAASVLALIVLLTLRRAMRPLRAVGLLVAGATLLVVAAIPLAPLIEKRLTGDFSASVDFRTAYNEAAFGMWEANPVLGAGPANFSLEIRRYTRDPYVTMSLDALKVDQTRDKAHLRSVAPVHNVYLFVLSELGMAGLIGFLLFLGRSLVLAWRASGRLKSAHDLFAAGLFCGLLAEFAQQQIDYSLLWDPLLSTLVLVVGLLQSLANRRKGAP